LGLSAFNTPGALSGESRWGTGEIRSRSFDDRHVRATERNAKAGATEDAELGYRRRLCDTTF
jgi:hypothetical protein